MEKDTWKILSKDNVEINSEIKTQEIKLKEKEE